MGKLRKNRTKYQYSRNRRREWKRKTKEVHIGCEPVKNAWDSKKTVNENMRVIGLTADPNKALATITTAEEIVESQAGSSKPSKKKKTRTTQVIEELEADANAPREKMMRLSEPEVRYCTYMIDRYGDDYKAMARDHKNYYQETPKQIRKKINIFKNIPEQYQEYLDSKKTDEMEAT